MKAVVAALNQEKALVGAFSVITNLRMELFEALVSTNQAPLPVMVWIHGGAYNAGSGNDYVYWPLYYMSHDIILVSIR